MKVYVVLRDYYNGDWYEDEDHEIDRFMGVFPTRELADEFARNEINKLSEYMTTNKLHAMTPLNIWGERDTRIVDGDMIVFDTYYDQGYIRYNVRECDTDSKNPQCT